MRYRMIQTGLDMMGFMQADRWLSGLGMAGLKQGRGFILTLHRVRPPHPPAFAPNQFLDITPQFLDHSLTFFQEAGFEPLSIDQVPERLTRTSAREKPFFVVTFDDGYRDVLEHAWPILRKHRCPWTVYITSDYAQGQGRIWWLELEEAIAQQSTIRLQIGPHHIAMATRSTEEKAKAYKRLRDIFYTSPSRQWPAMLDGLREKSSGPSRQTPAQLCANWRELAAISNDPSITIGSHTLTHPILSQIGDAQAKQEIDNSKVNIAQALGTMPRHFSYPSGGTKSFSARDIALVRQAGYQTAVTTRPAHVWPIIDHPDAAGTSLMTLPRISLNGHFQSDQWLRAIASGLPFSRT